MNSCNQKDLLIPLSQYKLGINQLVDNFGILDGIQDNITQRVIRGETRGTQIGNAE